MREATNPTTVKRTVEPAPDGRTLWRSLSIGVAFLTPDGRFRLVNASLEVLLGASNRMLAGQPFSRYFPEIGAPERLLVGHQSAALTTQLVAGPGVSRKVWLTLRHEEEVDPEAGMLLEVVDAEEAIRSEREAAVSEASAAARELLRNLAHEIKNPLGGIRGAAQLLETSLTNEDDKECASIIREEADRLQTLVDRFLEPYRRPREEAYFNVSAALEHVRGLLQHEFPQLSVVRDYDVSAPDLFGDKGRLTQVFLNIARNAAEVMATTPNGRITLRTRIVRDAFLRHRRVKTALCVFIEDTGPGIPEALRERLFYPLVTGRPEGSGLGLSIADTFVREAGGAIEVESEPGRTVFRVLLPYR